MRKNFCIPYKNNNKYCDEAAQLSIRFKAGDSAETAIQFCNEHTHQTIVIFLAMELKELTEVSKDFARVVKKVKNEGNFIFELPCGRNLEIVADVYECAAPLTDTCSWYFDLPVCDWETLHTIIEFHPNDIIISEQLGFELDKVSAILKANDIKLRVYPDIAQFKCAPSIYSFYIRPEDVEYYSEYVDVFEFYDMEEDGTRAEAKYECYAKTGHFVGPLKVLIPNLELAIGDVPNNNIIANFSTRRATCSRRCMKGHPCIICPNAISISNRLKELHLSLDESQT